MEFFPKDNLDGDSCKIEIRLECDPNVDCTRLISQKEDGKYYEYHYSLNAVKSVCPDNSIKSVKMTQTLPDSYMVLLDRANDWDSVTLVAGHSSFEIPTLSNLPEGDCSKEMSFYCQSYVQNAAEKTSGVVFVIPVEVADQLLVEQVMSVNLLI